MRGETFDKILHPEIILGRRGDSFLIKSYESARWFFDYDESFETWAARNPLALLELFPSLDHPMVHHHMICKKYFQEKPKNYRLGRDFAEVLAGVKSDIPIDKLPDRWFGFISFPNGTVKDDTGSVYGAYVFIGKGKETSAKPELREKKMIWASVIGESPVEGDHSCQHILMELEDSFEKTFRALEHDDDDRLKGEWERNGLTISSNAVDLRLEAMRAIVNSVLYINSLEPNLDDMRPSGHLSHGKRKKLREAGQNVNLCTIPVVAVNWSYMKDRSYNVSETYRREHLRWQRCGPGYSQVKLTTVKGHTVKFKKDEAE